MVPLSVPHLVTSSEAMSTFCPFTTPVITPSVSWGGTFPSMASYADVFYLGQLWELARPRGEQCSQNSLKDRHLDEHKKTTKKRSTRDIGKLLRHATAKTLRYAQRDSYRRHKDSTYIVLNNLADDESSEEEFILSPSNSDFSASTGFRSSLSLKAERIMRRKRR